MFPSLGILKVAAAAEQQGFHVEHLDLNGVQNYDHAVLQYCLSHSVDVFAITATTPQMVAATKILGILRCASPASVIIGGPHPTLVHAGLAYSPRSLGAMVILQASYDAIVVGDGELAIGPAIDAALQHRIGPCEVIDADNPKSGLFMNSNDLEALPLPARHLVDLGSYHYTIDGVGVTPLIGQLGCPFGCNFCAGRDSAMLRRVRLRSTEHVIAEMRHIYNTYGIHGFMFFDDELNVNRQVLQLLHAIIDLQEELGVAFRCRGFIKSELFTEEQAAAMYQAGFRRILCGFESGSDHILKNINKQATKSDNTKTMELSHKYGLETKALMSLGHPGESPETAMDTLDWLKAVAPKDLDVTIITAYPGSPYYDRAQWVSDNRWVFETNGDKLYMEDVDYTQVEDFYKGSMDAYKSYVSTDALTSDAIVDLRNTVEIEARTALGIPFYSAGTIVKFEASMGQLPGVIYRRSNDS